MHIPEYGKIDLHLRFKDATTNTINLNIIQETEESFTLEKGRCMLDYSI